MRSAERPNAETGRLAGHALRQWAGARAMRDVRGRAVATGALRDVECVVGGFEERLPIDARFGERRDADRARDAERASLGVEGRLGELFADALGEEHGALLVRLLAQRHEFFAAEARDDFGGSLVALEDLG